jgi:hypothetical protein
MRAAAAVSDILSSPFCGVPATAAEGTATQWICIFFILGKYGMVYLAVIDETIQYGTTFGAPFKVYSPSVGAKDFIYTMIMILLKM